jgi:hypothetical protein
MLSHSYLSPVLLFLVSVSMFGLFTTSMLTLYPQRQAENFLWRKPLIGSIFTLICVGGIVAVFFPKTCAETLGPSENKVRGVSDTRKNASLTSKGHHPDCSEFSAHTIKIKNASICASCTGLLVGGLAVLFLSVSYFFAGWTFGHLGLPLVFGGQAGIVLGFLHFKFESYVRLTINALFVLSAFLVLAGVDALTANMLLDLYIVGLIVLWLFTRISISKWNNTRICRRCGPCKLTVRYLPTTSAVERSNDD